MQFNGINFDTYFKDYPNKEGFFGPYGGVYVDDNLKKAMAEITEAYFTICKSRKFIAELRRIRKEFQGRPTPISHLERLSNSLGNVQLYVKREDLNHTGAHKLNHCMGEGCTSTTGSPTALSASCIATEVCVYAAAFTTSPSNTPIAAWMRSTSAPSWFDWNTSTSTPASPPVSSMNCTRSA